MECHLIITADDFGFSKERNQGVIDVFKTVAIKSASLLLNCTGTDQAVQLLKTHELRSGLHLNLTEGHALSKNAHTTLTNSAGEFWGKFELRRLLESGSIDPQEIKGEIDCQIGLFKDLVGHYPLYVDGHQHIHVHPAVADIFSASLHAHGIQVTRFPVEIFLDRKHWVKSSVIPFYNRVMEDTMKCKPLFENGGIRYADAFVGLSTMGADMTPERLQSSILEGFQAAENQCDPTKTSIVTCELMCHPGYATGKDDGGFDGHSDEFGCSKDREHEIKVLSSKEMLEFYEKNNIILSSHEVLCDK